MTTNSTGPPDQGGPLPNSVGQGSLSELPENKALRDRRLKLGIDMYQKLGVGKGDMAGSLRALKRNYTFFDAPVGLLVTVDKR